MLDDEDVLDDEDEFSGWFPSALHHGPAHWSPPELGAETPLATPTDELAAELAVACAYDASRASTDPPARLRFFSCHGNTGGAFGRGMVCFFSRHGGTGGAFGRGMV